MAGRRHRQRGRDINGWIALDKPTGMTSATAVAEVKRLFQARKAGHAGTLDPIADGMLPIALGEATKLVNFLVDAPKIYQFTIRWGEERDTDDSEGAVLQNSALRPQDGDILGLLPRYIGQIEQVPPRFSAIKVDGERAYDLARQGLAFELPSRPVDVYDFQLVQRLDEDHHRFQVRCGRGTYVRSLARDLGRDLGCGGHVAQLRRCQVGAFGEDNAISLDNLTALSHNGALEQALLPIPTALADIPALAVTGDEAERLRCGQTIHVPHQQSGLVLAKTDGKAIAVAMLDAHSLRPLRVLKEHSIRRS